jgi:hypothetical protein
LKYGGGGGDIEYTAHMLLKNGILQNKREVVIIFGETTNRAELPVRGSP